EVKSKRPDIIRLAGEAHEDPRIIARAADLVVNSDFVSRGHRLALLAKKMGAGALVHISSFIGTPTSSPRDTRAGPASKSPKNTCGLESASGTRRRPERRFPNVRAG
ncbi:MAG: DUF3798 domain-containing protein, partial [Planctomycetota bacterium]|nr:DUF3798 domain-containing protein [Planctomycetota bacterium]